MLDVALRVDRPRFPVEASFCLEAGERLGLFGPSGSGKSTILDAIAGLVPLDAGRVLLGGRDLAEVGLWERRVGLVRQRPALFPHLSVADNVRYGAPRRARGPVEGEAELCERLGIAHLLAARPGQLSGGQRQRVALARALAAPARALLLDEPFQGLDTPVRHELVAVVRDLVAGRDLPAVLVSHDLDEVQGFATVVGVLDEGRLLQVGGPAEVVRRPASLAVARLVGYVAAPAPGRSGEAVGVHPGRVRLGVHPGATVLAGVVRAVRPRGPGEVAEVELAGGALVPVAVEPEAAPAPEVGDRVDLSVTAPPRFDADGLLVGEPAGAPLAVAPGRP